MDYAKPNVPEHLRSKMAELRKYVASRLPRVESKEMAGSHLLGIATRAIVSLEVLMRDLLRFYLVWCRFEYESDVQQRLKLTKPFEKLTLGEVINCFRTLNTQMSLRLRDRFPDLPPKLFPKHLDTSLGDITATRKSLQHYNVPILRDKTRDLLVNIEKVLSEPLFEIFQDS
jgi:hypothetical protein